MPSDATSIFSSVASGRCYQFQCGNASAFQNSIIDRLLIFWTRSKCW